MEIIKYNGFNISGICEAKFAFVSEIKSIVPLYENHQMLVHFKPNKGFSDLYFSQASEKCETKEINDKSGKYYQTLIELNHPRLDPQKSFHFDLLKDTDLIFMFKDKHGNRILVGSMEMPARISYSLSLSANQRNQRTVSIEAVSDQEPFYLADAVSVYGRAFSSGFSEGFS